MIHKQKLTNWEITTDRFVGFIDIMGFKDMVMRNNHEYIYELMKKIYKSIKNNDFGKYTGESLVKVTTYSDSIILYSKDDSDKSFYELVSSVSGIIFDLFSDGIPHKGSIAYGKMTMDSKKSIFFGQPLIDAYQLQEDLYSYSVLIHGSVEEKSINNLNTNLNIIKYNCHLKNGRANHYVVCPMFASSDSRTLEEYNDEHESVINSLDKMRFRTSGNLRRYIDNTGDFFDCIQEQTLKK